MKSRREQKSKRLTLYNTLSLLPQGIKRRAAKLLGLVSTKTLIFSKIEVDRFNMCNLNRATMK